MFIYDQYIDAEVHEVENNFYERNATKSCVANTVITATVQEWGHRKQSELTLSKYGEKLPVRPSNRKCFNHLEGYVCQTKAKCGIGHIVVYNMKAAGITLPGCIHRDYPGQWLVVWENAVQNKSGSAGWIFEPQPSSAKARKLQKEIVKQSGSEYMTLPIEPLLERENLDYYENVYKYQY